jgi:hypothetical protein
MYVCCECRVLSGRGLCDELITRPEESYRLWFVVVCDVENLVNVEDLAHWENLSRQKQTVAKCLKDRKCSQSEMFVACTCNHNNEGTLVILVTMIYVVTLVTIGIMNVHNCTCKLLCSVIRSDCQGFNNLPYTIHLR